MYEIISKDKEVFLFLNNLGSSAFDPFWIMVSEKWIWIPLYIIFLYLLYKNYKLKSLLFILIFIAIGITISDQIANIFKFGIERLRPCHDPTLDHLMREVECRGSFGFFSAHSSNSFFIATFMVIMLKNKYRYLSFILFFWATMVAYSRIYLGVHFPLDIVFGAMVGFLLGGFFATLSLNVIKKQSR